MGFYILLALVIVQLGLLLWVCTRGEDD